MAASSPAIGKKRQRQAMRVTTTRHSDRPTASAGPASERGRLIHVKTGCRFDG
jgi:hypothetical protein